MVAKPPAAETSVPGPARPESAASADARRQLGRLMRWLAVLDISVVAWVVLLALAWSVWHFRTVVFLVGVLVGVGAVLAVRVALAVQLHRKAVRGN